MKSIIIFSLFIISFVNSQAQINNAQTETVKIFGNCGMCETAIEKAANKKNISKADWNEETKMATITFDSKKTNLEAVLKNIALAGYDSDKFLAPDLTYNKLSDCCKYDRENKAPNIELKNGTELDNMGTLVNNANTSVSPTQQTNQLQSLLDAYIVVKDALVKTDATGAASKAKNLLSSLNAVKMETLKPEEHTAWMQYEKEINKDALHIAESKDVEKQRAYFSTLSKNMYQLIKSAKLSDKIYYQYCPMYDDNKGGNWLSKDIAIKNPYFGSMMLSCGKTVETIQ
jgi:copper chaperone CopZ